MRVLTNLGSEFSPENWHTPRQHPNEPLCEVLAKSAVPFSSHGGCKCEKGVGGRVPLIGGSPNSAGVRGRLELPKMASCERQTSQLSASSSTCPRSRACRATKRALAPPRALHKLGANSLHARDLGRVCRATCYAQRQATLLT